MLRQFSVSVCPSRSCTVGLSKRLNVSPSCFHCNPIILGLVFFHSKHHGDTLTLIVCGDKMALKVDFDHDLELRHFDPRIVHL